MRATGSLRPLLALLVLAFAGLYGCGKGGSQQPTGGGTTTKIAPVAAQGAVSVATRNTTRLGGADAASNAAAVARAVYPGLTQSTRPQAVVLVDQRQWLPALASSVLSGAPAGSPILFTEGNTLPTVSRETLEAMRPLGAPSLGGAQVIRIGNSAAVPDGYVTHTLPASAEPAVAAAAIERLLLILGGGKAPHQVIVLAAGTPQSLAMPAAGLSAESAAPILFVTPAHIPTATATVLARLKHPSIYVIDPSAVGSHTLDRLGRLGQVTSVTSAVVPAGGDEAVQSAIEVARYTDGTFGWGVKEPGHGLVFVNAAHPLDAPASALLSATGDYGPLLLLASATRVPSALAGYLFDIRPAYRTPQFPPVRGAYNHGWLIGDEHAISAATQAEIDSMLEIAPQPQSSEEPSVSQVE